MSGIIPLLLYTSYLSRNGFILTGISQSRGLRGEVEEGGTFTAELSTMPVVVYVTDRTADTEIGFWKESG